MKLALYLSTIAAILFVGCQFPAVMTASDWQRLEDTVKPSLTAEEWTEFKTGIESRTMTPEEFEAWKAKLTKDVAAIMTGIVDISPIPGPAKAPVNDLVEYSIYALLARVFGPDVVKGGKKLVAKSNGGKNGG